MRVFILAVFLLTGCVAAVPHTSLTVNLTTKQRDLAIFARQALNHAGIVEDEKAPGLSLSETISEDVSLIGSDGTAVAYEIYYELMIHWQGKNFSLQREAVVSHNESSYLAGQRQRTAAANGMRQNALLQMISLLKEGLI